MKKPNRRSKRTTIADSSSPAKDENNKQQHYEKRVGDLEKENEALKTEIEEMKLQLVNVSPTSAGVQKLKKDDSQKLHAPKEQVMESKRKFNAKYQLSTQKQKSSAVAKLPQDEIQRLKAQKVQLLCKMKLESVQSRLSKASLEKEVLQLKKKQRRNEYEMRKLLALNQRQKLVLQRKTEEASMATKRLNELLESRKALTHKASGAKNGNSPGIQGMELELKVAARVQEIRSEYEHQMEEMADEVRKFEEEAETLRHENFSFLLQDKEVDCAVKDSELRDLKEEVVRLSNMVSQLRMPKAHPQVDLVKSSVLVGSSIEVLDMDTSESEHSGVNIAAMGKSASGACCSCSKKSLCKTTKCGCRAAGGSCGPHCGCAASKCTNRAVVSKVDDSLQKEETQDLLHLSGTSETAKGNITSQPAELNNNFQPRRRPLREIKNALMNLSPVKSGQKTRKQKPTIPLDSADSYFSLQENAKDPKNQTKLL